MSFANSNLKYVQIKTYSKQQQKFAGVDAETTVEIRVFSCENGFAFASFLYSNETTLTTTTKNGELFN